jgi:hypothetical protein
MPPARVDIMNRKIGLPSALNVRMPISLKNDDDDDDDVHLNKLQQKVLQILFSTWIMQTSQ